MKERRGIQKKAEYLWTYYKFQALLLTLVILGVFYFAHAAVAEREPAFTAYLFDAYGDINQEIVETKFAESAGINTKESAVTIDASYLIADSSVGNYAMTSLAKFYTQIGTKELDVCLMTADNFLTYAKSGTFLNLQECLSEELLIRYEEKFVYENGEPVGIRGDGLKWIEQTRSYPDTECIFGIVYNSEKVDNAVKFLKFLDGEES